MSHLREQRKRVSRKIAIGENGFIVMIEDSEVNGISIYSMKG